MSAEIGNVPLTAVVDELLMLIVESAEYQRHDDIKRILSEAQEILVAVRHRLHVAVDRYVVGVVGLSNVGKSTLLNALLGSELAPRRNGPCTAAPIEFTYGKMLQLTAYYHHGLRRPQWLCENVEAIHRRLAALADDSGTEASQSIRKVEVQVPSALLKGGLVVADTPGFGAAQLNGAQGTHEQALQQYLQHEISQVFWVVLAEQGIGKREISFYDQFFADICDDVVVTGCEDWGQEDRDRFRRRFAECFGQRMPAFHFVSGLEGLKARQTNDQLRLEAAGIPLLEGASANWWTQMVEQRQRNRAFSD